MFYRQILFASVKSMFRNHFESSSGVITPLIASSFLVVGCSAIANRPQNAANNLQISKSVEIGMQRKDVEKLLKEAPYSIDDHCGLYGSCECRYRKAQIWIFYNDNEQVAQIGNWSPPVIAHDQNASNFD